jgi:methionyl aminopeptidase
MISIKTDEEVAAMRKGGKMLADTLWEVMRSIKPGMTELEVDALAERLIREKGGEPGFKLVPRYRHTICAATNDVVVHGIPTTYALKKGDVFCVDCGVYYKGLHTDMAETIIVGGDDAGSPEAKKFLENGKKALKAGISMAKAGNRVGHISKAIQDIVESEGGYSVVRSLVGHGVGRELHEAPEVPGYIAKPIEKTPLLKKDMTIAIEVIYNMGGKDVTLDHDGWTIRTKDGSLSAVFERSVVITDKGAELLTP